MPPLTSDESKGFLAGVSVDALREKVQREPYRALWQRTISRSQALIAAARESNFELHSHGGIGYHSKTPMVLSASLLYRLGNDLDALKYVEQCIAAVDRHERERDMNSRRVLVHSDAEVAIAADICRPSLSRQAIDTLLPFMRDVAIPSHCGSDQYTGYMGGANTCWWRNTAGAICALLWGDDCGYKNWRDVVEHGIMHSRCYLKYGCDETGLSYEGMGYGHGVFTHLFRWVQLLKQHGYVDLFKTEPRLREIAESSLHSLFPDRRFMINTNDVGLQGGENPWWLQLTAKEYDEPLHRGFWNEYTGPDHTIRPYGDPASIQNARSQAPRADGTHGLFFNLLFWDAEAPATPVADADRDPVLFSPGTAAASIRTSWSTDAVYVNICGGGRSAASMTHRHADAGHFSIFAYGDYLVIDTGRYNVNEDQHNVVLVDGKCAHFVEGWGQDFWSGRLTAHQTNDLLSYCCIDAAHMKDCRWALRHFMFVPYGPDQAYLITFDSINKDGQVHTNWWQLQANPDYEFTIPGGRQAALHGDNARLDISFAIPTIESFPAAPPSMTLRQDVQDWGKPYGGDNAKAQHEGTGLVNTCLERPRLIAEVESNWIMAAISPRRKDEAPLPIRQIDECRVLRLEIDCGAFIDTILAAPDHGCIQLADVQALTELALIRRDPEGKLLATWTVDDAEIHTPDRGGEG